ncbi:mevalonate kinase [Neptunomonas qingdaonensis]|uniref:Mevalonate kinase n=1 Tax=Neptunomonas qingdaonensis TaxID=1045558 RepID=A0A1I2NY76_9GAMM|nr:mevalonate kinase [Neptunomonas qingdaonensis]SFG06221.1 mevalonate kinase [Neptunomonas qingdaonensis]
MEHATSVIKVTAPGSIMLMGEHAVLFGHRAIACAVDKRMQVSLMPRADRVVVIRSALADYHSTLDDLEMDSRLNFVIFAIRQVAADLPNGFEVDIHSEFSHTVGLGSSAAVTAALVKALSIYQKEKLPRRMLFERALAVIHGVQGRGSGTDLAASVYGGLIGYTVKPQQVSALNGLPPISLFYAGYKTKTADVLARVAEHTKAFPELYSSLYQLMHDTTIKAEDAIQKQNWPELGSLMNVYQGLMDALGVNDAVLSDIVYSLRRSDAILGAKISGSGLGDCVIALGTDESLSLGYESIAVAVSGDGVEVEVASHVT